MLSTDSASDSQAPGGGPAIELDGLWLVEFLELSGALPPGTIDQRPPREDDGRTHGDLGTVVAVVTLTSAVLQSLTAWLQARQTRQRPEQRATAPNQGYALERRPDGTIVLSLPRLDGTGGPSSGVPLEELRAQLERFLQDLDGAS
ncbi:hypothetical protein M2160_000556 [Streptomyces sp. SAI-117]|uniref:hypothetical protein n=1 Tax=Streptomyces sp. SAI-117 TaxID=2940546 RepID=UPI002473F774|nr:hypothetical protein [Streptomyces sp. SAI-117]MDH6565535.1 hypothetical protein [Streptomyces sp. SAI-117]